MKLIIIIIIITILKISVEILALLFWLSEAE